MKDQASDHATRFVDNRHCAAIPKVSAKPCYLRNKWHNIGFISPYWRQSCDPSSKRTRIESNSNGIAAVWFDVIETPGAKA